ncbi:MAG TPA: hypothetical protein VGS07_25650 [Thermoanaerobaculia bacterium]|jgi:hypothetical protein|nr:hypothetical protein [Thermoanaerobaculia bacterium]
MIRILKPPSPPEILADEGRKATADHCNGYEANPAAYQNGTRAFSFDSGIYGHASVKDRLIEAQHGKCCFCEAKITHISYWRPGGDPGHTTVTAERLRGGETVRGIANCGVTMGLINRIPRAARHSMGPGPISPLRRRLYQHRRPLLESAPFGGLLCLIASAASWSRPS